MSTNAAVSLNYGMFRRKEINGTAQYLMFYDMGSSQTTATVVSYQTVKTKDKLYSETNPQLTVLGVGSVAQQSKAFTTHCPHSSSVSFSVFCLCLSFNIFIPFKAFCVC